LEINAPLVEELGRPLFGGLDGRELLEPAHPFEAGWDGHTVGTAKLGPFAAIDDFADGDAAPWQP